MQSKEASDPVLSPEIQSSLKAISFAEAGSLPIKKDGITKDNIQHLMERIKIIFVMKYLKTDYQPAEIRPNLFLGSIGAAFSKKTLDSLGITHVVCCLDKPLTPFQNVFLLNPTHEFWSEKKQDFQYINVPLADSETQDIKKYFAKTNAQLTEILSNKKNKVLIHCFAGKSRSTTVLVSYLMQAEKKKRDEVLQKVKEKRPIVQPNEGFMKQLLEWEKELKI